MVQSNICKNQKTHIKQTKGIKNYKLFCSLLILVLHIKINLGIKYSSRAFYFFKCKFIYLIFSPRIHLLSYEAKQKNGTNKHCKSTSHSLLSTSSFFVAFMSDIFNSGALARVHNFSIYPFIALYYVIFINFSFPL